MDYSPPGSSVYGFSQAKILEWVAISFSRGSFPPRDQICVSGIGRQILCHWSTWEALIFLGSKITVDGDSHSVMDGDSHEIKRRLLLGRKAMTNLDSVLKSRDITLLTKILLVKAVVFPVVMYGYDSWNIKKAEHWWTDAFKLWCWRRLLRVPWITRRSNQSILKEISPEYSLEDWCWSWSFNILATWCKEPTH